MEINLNPEVGDKWRNELHDSYYVERTYTSRVPHGGGTANYNDVHYTVMVGETRAHHIDADKLAKNWYLHERKIGATYLLSTGYILDRGMGHLLSYAKIIPMPNGARICIMPAWVVLLKPIADRINAHNASQNNPTRRVFSTYEDSKVIRPDPLQMFRKVEQSIAPLRLRDPDFMAAMTTLLSLDVPNDQLSAAFEQLMQQNTEAT